MKVKWFVAVALVISTVMACNKTVCPKEPLPEPVDDTHMARLKDLTIRNLPSPYYHFEYNDSGYITRASYVSNFWQYELGYDSRRLSVMQNQVVGNSDRLDYTYSGGNISAITVTDVGGVQYQRYLFTYNIDRQLTKMQLELRQGDVFVPEQTMTFQYYGDGNLMEQTTHFHPVGPQTELQYTDRFENYDNKINAEGFSLLHNSQFRHAILLPSVKLQRNNPRRIVRTGEANNYQVDYTYTYDAEGKPLVKNGELVFTSGADNGKHFQLQTTYTWY